MPKQQTALREAIVEFERLKEAATGLRDKLYLDGVLAVLTGYIDKERQQIEDAYNAGMSEFGNRQATPCHTDIESSDYFTNNFEQ